MKTKTRFLLTMLVGISIVVFGTLLYIVSPPAARLVGLIIILIICIPILALWARVAVGLWEESRCQTGGHPLQPQNFWSEDDDDSVTQPVIEKLDSAMWDLQREGFGLSSSYRPSFPRLKYCWDWVMDLDWVFWGFVAIVIFYVLRL